MYSTESHEDRAQGLRVVLYSHDSVGLGHSRRNLAIARALSEKLSARTGRRVSGLLVTGERTATSFPCPPGFDWVVVPGITKSRQRYVPRTLDIGTRRLMDIRSAVLEGTLTSFRPHLVIVDRHPFGADGELERPLQALRRVKPDTTVVLGLREVLDGAEVARREWEAIGVEKVREQIDEIWVYGDRRIHDTVASGEVPVELADRVRFTGLLSQGREADVPGPDFDRDFVLTMFGGGSDGERLGLAAAAARVPDGHHHFVVTGPQMPQAARDRITAVAGPDTTVLDEVPDGLSCIRRAAAVVTMGGYNTINEVLSTDTPAVVVPRVVPRAEQLIRATGLAQVGATDMLHPREADSAALADWMETTVSSPVAARSQVRARAHLETDGLDTVVGLAAALSGRTDRRTVPAGTRSVHTGTSLLAPAV
ncbi:glycosyltransferase family protein [Brevibacterium litoralis]|uniref:glycosyltransferase family protein n=1 Tax=Brevibacterium litoralis TaxID=3138935 RepID=UPI0032ECC6A9